MLSNPGIKNGLLLGALTIIFTTVSYFVNPKMMMNGVAMIVSYVLVIFFMYRAAVEEKKSNEGILSFGDALKVTFLAFIIGNLIITIYTYIMYNFVDPSLNDVAKEVALETAESVAKLLGAEGEQLDSLPEQMENQDIVMSAPMLFLNYLTSLIFPGFIIALVIAAITKKESSNHMS